MPQSLKTLYRQRVDAGNLKPDLAQSRAAEALDGVHAEIVRAFRPGKRAWIKRTVGIRPDIRGLYIHGAVGRGKSMLMDLFYDALPDHIPRRRVHFHEFMIGVHAAINAREDKRGGRVSVDNALPKLAENISDTYRILCFDEFHVTDIADAMILGRLFTALFKAGVVVVATSNWPPDRLYEGGLQRELFLPFIALLKENMEVLHLDSPVDYRAQCLMEEGSYFWPLGDTTHSKVSALFSRLINYEMPQEEHLSVQGRTVTVQAAHNGVACFTFSQLCEQPMGASDYIEIAKTYRTVFVEGVPKMGYDRRNEAKRFMTLIDVLYEHKTKLILSADALPDRLYFGKDHAFEFERTVSRLREMQSGGYLGE